MKGLFLLAVLLISTTANAGLLNGKTLYKYSQSPKNSTKYMQYSGYVAGVAGFSGVTQTLIDNLNTGICVPLNQARIVRDVTRVLKELPHVEEGLDTINTLSAADLTYLILFTLYPCQ